MNVFTKDGNEDKNKLTLVKDWFLTDTSLWKILERIQGSENVLGQHGFVNLLVYIRICFEFTAFLYSYSVRFQNLKDFLVLGFKKSFFYTL